MNYIYAMIAGIVFWECGKWLYRIIFFKTAEVIIPAGRISCTVYRFQKSVDPDEALKTVMEK